MANPEAIASNLEPGETWAERLWFKNHHRLKRYILLLTAFGGFSAYMLFRAGADGLIYGGPRAARRWISVDQEPTAFWYAVLFDAAVLAMCVGVATWVAWDLRRLAKKRHRG